MDSFSENAAISKSKFSKNFIIFIKRKKIRKIPLKNDFENQNFAIFEEVVNNFGM